MEITWLGHACFRLKGKDVTIITDPYDKPVGYTLGRPSADVVTVSHGHHDHNNTAAISGSPKILQAPGEYEIKNVFIKGIATFHDGDEGRARGRNTAFTISVDDVIVCHLGDLGHVLTQAQAEELDEVDVLLIPVGGTYTIDATQASEVVGLLEPKIVIPMHYQTEALTLGKTLDPVDKFLKEMGQPNPTPQPKLVVTKSSLPEQTQVVVLDYRR
jgi:L-ascorbate metabolism protein UlaG (beta-lactamase superfamily)